MLKSFIFVLLLIPFKSFADVDVDWPERKAGENYHILAITVDGCETRFHIKNEDFYKFTANEKALGEALDKAEERAANGCK